MSALRWEANTPAATLPEAMATIARLRAQYPELIFRITHGRDGYAVQRATRQRQEA
jgi:hypothetical protein